MLILWFLQGIVQCQPFEVPFRCDGWVVQSWHLQTEQNIRSPPKKCCSLEHDAYDCDLELQKSAQIYGLPWFLLWFGFDVRQGINMAVHGRTCGRCWCRCSRGSHRAHPRFVIREMREPQLRSEVTLVVIADISKCFRDSMGLENLRKYR